MTLSQDNKFDKSGSAPKPKKRRAMRGNPQPYRDGNRWKAKGHFLDPNGRQVTVTGTGATQKAAVARKEQLIKQRLAELQQRKIPDGATRVAAYCRYWLEKVKQPQDQLAYKTYTGYESALRNWIEPQVGTLKLTDLKRQHLIDMFEAIRVKGLSKSMQIQVRAVIKQALEHAYGEGHIDQNPYRSIKLMKQANGLPQFFEFDEAGKLMRSAKVLNQELNLDIQLNYGLRQSERLGLTWDDVDIDSEEPTFTLTRQLQHQKGKGKILVGLKTNACQVFYPTPYTVELFRAQRAAFELGRAVHGDQWNNQNFVFWNARGNPIDTTSDRKTWIKILNDAGLDFKVGHTTRKTTGTLIEDPEVAFQVLGHRQQTTMYKHYRATRAEKKKAAIADLQRQILES